MSFEVILPLFGAALFLAGLAVLIILLLQILRTARLSKREKRHRLIAWQSDLRRMLAIMAALAAVGLGNLAFWVSGQLKLYAPVYPGIPLGMISIVKPDNALPRLVYITTDREGREAFEVFPVRDARFRLAGERIRWPRQFATLGLGEFFKVTRIEFLPEGADSAADGDRFSVDVRQGSSALFGGLLAYRRWLSFVRIDTLSTPTCDAHREYSAQLFVDSAGLILH